MSALELVRAGATRWAIVDTIYFDSALHRFVGADIEIDGTRIAAVLPPRTSTRTIKLAGDQAVCLPGLIDPDAGSHHDDWSAFCRSAVMHGFTTVGMFCRNGFECRRAASAASLRCLCYVELGESQAEHEYGGDAESEWAAFEQIARMAEPGRFVPLPAVVPAAIWSATALAGLASFAAQSGQRLCVRLCATARDAQQYKETRFFTELGLLSYLSLLTNATIFDLSQVSGNDAAALNESPAHIVCGPGRVNEWLLQRHYPPFSLWNRAIGFASRGGGLGDARRYTALVLLSMALIKRTNCERDACDLVADGMTRSAAAALGIDDIGAIAANMRADLCIFDRSAEFLESCDRCDSLAFLKLLARGRPRHVLIDGSPVVIEHACMHETAESGPGSLVH
jgi:cytosine/adenosine deaminase-related metal-dependent hydrolase